RRPRTDARPAPDDLRRRRCRACPPLQALPATPAGVNRPSPPGALPTPLRAGRAAGLRPQRIPHLGHGGPARQPGRPAAGRRGLAAGPSATTPRRGAPLARGGRAAAPGQRAVAAPPRPGAKRAPKAPDTSRPQDPKKPYPYIEEEITFENKKARITLAGTLTLPSRKGHHPVTLLISGAGPNDRNEA